MFFSWWTPPPPPPPPTLLESITDKDALTHASGWAGFCFALLVPLMSSPKMMAMMQVMDNLTFYIHYSLIGAHGGAASQLMGLVNGLLKYNETNSTLCKHCLRIFPLALVPVGFLTVETRWDLLPLTAVGGRLLSYQASSMLKIRILQAAALLPWFPYAIALGNSAALLTACLSMFLCVASILRYHADDIFNPSKAKTS